MFISKLKLWVLTFLGAAAFYSYVHAIPLEFQEYNFQIEIPDGWKEVTPPAGITWGAQSPDTSKTVFVSAPTTASKERVASSREMFEGVKQGMKSNGWSVTSEKDVTIHLLPFHSATLKGTDGKTSVIYTTSAGERMYSIVLFSQTTEAGNDPDILSIAYSFKLISPYPPNESPGYALGYFMGKNFSLVATFTVVVALLLWFIIRKMIRRSKRSRRALY